MGTGLSGGLGGVGMPSGFSAGPVGYRGRNAFHDTSGSSAMGSDMGFNPNDSLTLVAPTPARSRLPSGLGSKKRLSEMTARERNGLAGLAAKLDPEHPDYSQFAVGHDLTQLGLELNRPE
jgi:hypothetical protein